MSKGSRSFKQRPRAAASKPEQSPEKTRLLTRVLVWGGVLLIMGVCLIAYRYAGMSEAPQLQAARSALERRDFSAATKSLTDYLEHEPGDVGARLLAAQAARRGGDYATAARYLKQCMADDTLPELYELESRLLALARGDAEQADFLFNFCTTHDSAPETPLILEALIEADLSRLAVPLGVPRAYLLDGIPPELERLQQTTDLWLQTRSSAPDQVQGLVWRGRARAMLGDHLGSLADFRRALELDGNHFEAAAYLALSIASEQPHEALAQLEQLRQRHPNDRRVLFAIAPLLRSTGQIDQAAKLFDELLRTNPDMPQLLIERAQVSLDRKQPAEAKRYLDRAASVAPESARLHLALSRYMVVIGDAEKAEQHQKRFLALESEPGR